MSSDRYEQGMAIRKAVLGADHVARAEANKTEFDADFQRFITESVWGDVWSRPGLELKTRQMITMAMLAALGRHEELAAHIRATRHTGVTPAEVKEIFSTWPCMLEHRRRTAPLRWPREFTRRWTAKVNKLK